MGWQQDAACLDEDPRLFDAPKRADRNIGGRTPAFLRRLAAAQRVCDRCTVRLPCLTAAIDAGDEGIRGGQLLERDPKCGTVAGHFRHKKRGQKSCDECRAAINEYCSTASRAERAARRGQVIPISRNNVLRKRAATA